MQAIADAAPFFAPDLTVHRFPAWDCLPYDRAGPSMRISADRLATLSALQAPAKRGELILTTVAAITQRTLTPFRIRQLATTLAAGQRIDRDALEIGRAHVRNPVTNAHLVCRLMLEKQKKQTN